MKRLLGTPRRLLIVGIASLLLAAGVTQLPLFAFDSDGGLLDSPFSYSCGRVSTIWQYGISSDGTGREGGELREPNVRRDASCTLQFSIANVLSGVLGTGGLAAVAVAAATAGPKAREQASRLS